jgi:hypothetical protein
VEGLAEDDEELFGMHEVKTTDLSVLLASQEQCPQDVFEARLQHALEAIAMEVRHLLDCQSLTTVRHFCPPSYWLRSDSTSHLHSSSIAKQRQGWVNLANRAACASSGGPCW